MPRVPAVLQTGLSIQGRCKVLASTALVVAQNPRNDLGRAVWHPLFVAGKSLTRSTIRIESCLPNDAGVPAEWQGLARDVSPGLGLHSGDWRILRIRAVLLLLGGESNRREKRMSLWIRYAFPLMKSLAILVVEDHSIMREVVCEMLEDAGHQVAARPRGTRLFASFPVRDLISS